MTRDPEKPVLRILDKLPVPALVANPVTAKILWANMRLVHMAGATRPDEILGSSILDYIQLPQASTALADLAKVALGQSPPPVTYQLRKRDGQFAAAQVSSMPMIYEGQLGMLSIVTDVSERESLFLKLTESEERYRLLLESMPSGVVVVSGDDIVYANQAIACGLGLDSAQALIGRTMYEFIVEPQRKAVRNARREVLMTGAAFPAAPVTLIRADGSLLETTAATTRVHWEGELATQSLMYDVCVTREG
ncbi:MAG: PAS domain S-box protein [Coriobacteriia bacterium]|nr:PAS domain S-box protein [Coriobacteriia bacterium]